MNTRTFCNCQRGSPLATDILCRAHQQNDGHAQTIFRPFLQTTSHERKWVYEMNEVRGYFAPWLSRWPISHISIPY